METTEPTTTTPRSDRPSPLDPEISCWPRSRFAATAAACTVAAAGVATAVSATSVLGVIMFNHNETVVRSPGWS